MFGVALFATRLVQNWLSDRLLPETRFDPGVSNSISTIFGYVGGVVAVLLAAAQIGLDVAEARASSPARCRSASASACSRSPTISSPA